MAVWSGCSEQDNTFQPVVTDITESVYASALVRSSGEYEVYSTVNGTLESIYVQEGDSVKKGDLLFELDDRSARLLSENARLTSEAEDLDVNADLLTEARNSILLARQSYVNDSLYYHRQLDLRDNGIGSEAELDNSRLRFEDSQTRYNNAEIRYAQLSRQLKLADGLSSNREALARIDLEDRQIRSSIDGVIYRIYPEEHEVISLQQPLAVIGTSSFYLELTVDEYDITRIQPGQQVLIRTDSHEGQIFEGRITSIVPLMHVRTRSFTVRAAFVTRPEILYPNMSAEASIILREKKEALTIPRAALLNDSTVMLEGGQMQTVQTGLKDYERVEIISGLQADSRLEVPEQ